MRTGVQTLEHISNEQSRFDKDQEPMVLWEDRSQMLNLEQEHFLFGCIKHPVLQEQREGHPAEINKLIPKLLKDF